MTEQAKRAIKKNLKPFKVGVYEGIFRPSLQAGIDHKRNKHKHRICAWCRVVMGIRIDIDENTLGICDECLDTMRARICRD